MSGNERWEALVDLSVLLLEGELDLDALVEEIENKKFNKRIRRENEIRNDNVVANHDERKPIKKLVVKMNGNVLNPPIKKTGGLPFEEMKKYIVDLGGREESIVLVIEKELFESDVNPGQCRFSIPHGQVNGQFLEKLLKSEAARLGEGIPVTLFGARGEKHDMRLKNWETNRMYVLVGGWRNVCRDLGLKVDQSVQLWCFRRDSSDLCFALF